MRACAIILAALTLSQGARAYDWPKDRSDAVNRLCESALDLWTQSEDTPAGNAQGTEFLEQQSFEFNDAACELYQKQTKQPENYCQEHEDFCS